jgi:Ca-activated chloride channel family protein
MNASKYFSIGTFGLLLIVCAGFVLAQAPPQQPATDQPADIPNPQDPRYRIAVDVQLVNVITTVRDDTGRYLDDLKPEDFRVLENGSEQKVSFFSHDRRVPISLGVLLDVSGSMRHKLQQALQTVREFSATLSPDDEMFLATFGSDVSMRQKFTKNPQEIQRALRDVHAGGETTMYDAIQMAVREMRNAHHTKKIILLVTDGLDSRSKINAEQAEEILKRSDAMVYAVGLDDDDTDPEAQQRTRYHVYHYMLGKLTSETGGWFFRVFTGRKYAVDTLAQTLLQELHEQYTLSYYASVGDSSWRSVEVKVNRPNLQVRNRSGYYADPAVKTP